MLKELPDIPWEEILTEEDIKKIYQIHLDLLRGLDPNNVMPDLANAVVALVNEKDKIGNDIVVILLAQALKHSLADFVNFMNSEVERDSDISKSTIH